MGYIHDANMRYFVPPSLAGGGNGTWTHVVDGTNWYLNRAASSGTFLVGIPIAMPHQNTAENRGSRFSTIGIYYSIADADLTTMSAEFNLQELPTVAEFEPPGTPAFSYDTDHNTNAERVTQGNHVMTLSLTTAIWLAGTDYLRVDLYAVAPSSTVFRFWGAMIHYTLRI